MSAKLLQFPVRKGTEAPRSTLAEVFGGRRRSRPETIIVGLQERANGTFELRIRPGRPA